MHLTHRQLEAFRAMMETGSVTEAAQQIMVTQPAVSRLLTYLEHVVGYSLFQREKKRLTPTPEARAFLEEVERSYIGLDTISQAAREIGTYRRGALHIVALPALALNFLPKVIAEFCKKSPEISISLQINSSQKVVQSVATQQFDLGFSEVETKHRGITSALLREAVLVAALPNGHPLCAKSSLNPSDFDGENFVGTTTGHSTGNRISAFLTAENAVPKTRITTQLSYAAGQMVAQGAGIALIDPVTAAELERQSLITVRPFKPSLKYRYYILSPALRPRSSLANTFLDLVQLELAALLSEGD